MGAGAGAQASSTWRLQGGRLEAGARDSTPLAKPWLMAQDLVAEVATGAGPAPLLSLQLAPGRLQLAQTTGFSWRTASWAQTRADAPPTWQVQGVLESFEVAALLSRWQPELGWGGNLTVGGDVALRSTDRLEADIVLARGGGDLTLTDELGQVQPLGLSDIRLALSVKDGLWQFGQGLAGSSIGVISGTQVLRTAPESRWPDAQAPLQGVLQAKVGNLGAWGMWVPPGWRLSGALDVQGFLGGSFGAPQLRGTMQGRQLALRNMLQGVALTDGDLAVMLDGDTARIERLVFKGGEGTLKVTGQASLGEQPTARLQLAAERFLMIGRIDRRIEASGLVDLQLDRERLRADGQVRVDEGFIDVSRGDAPQLDSDVVVHRGSNGAKGGPVASATGTDAGPANGNARAPARPVQMQVKLDLGERLRLRGHGVDTGLRGELQLSTPGGKLAVNGTVRTHDGRFAAYGQKLDISRGSFQFTGALENPRLDVLAIRPNLDVLVGVFISGNAQSPRVRLYSEPELAEYDKLSWLVMGRSPVGLGSADTALLQRAAIALLAGNDVAPTDQLLNAIGLTDFSLRQTDGDTRDTIISLGKQLGRRWYVGYERSVNATTGTWQLVYRIAQRFTLRAQSGQENALDVIWSWRW